VTTVAGGVKDNATNSNAQQMLSFTLLMSIDAGNKIIVQTPSNSPASLLNAKFRFNGNHSLLTLQVNWGDGQIQNLTVPAGSGGGNITGQHTYATGGAYDITLTLQDNASHSSIDTTSAAVSAPACPWQNPLKRLDVNGNKVIEPVDAVLIINQLNAVGPGFLDNPPVQPFVPPPFFDVDCDNKLGPTDAVLVINALNSGEQSEGGWEPEEAFFSDDSNGFSEVGDDFEDAAALVLAADEEVVAVALASTAAPSFERAAATAAPDALAYWWANYMLSQAQATNNTQKK
jgi:hypothetical protein